MHLNLLYIVVAGIASIFVGGRWARSGDQASPGEPVMADEKFFVIQSQICIAYRKLIRTRNLHAIPSFYKELGIDPPRDHEDTSLARMRVATEASKAVLRRASKEYGSSHGSRFLCNDGDAACLTSKEEPLSELTNTWLLIAEIVSDERKGEVYDNYFLQLAGGPNSAQKLSDICHWGIEATD
ncbi:hypothetical protein QBC47DRAFT_408008 [Echria macrotheca]|uniref:Uncharacterized protein n=1 Tax=Echria macrotheca TaxID=438768 RepID=A0AAJ0B3C7_9PEZI|nr:hypothetical protein QBC47DRAFT_408008 [Echria macrotheca]